MSRTNYPVIPSGGWAFLLVHTTMACMRNSLERRNYVEQVLCNLKQVLCNLKQVLCNLKQVLCNRRLHYFVPSAENIMLSLNAMDATSDML